jgi:hypothetical protein
MPSIGKKPQFALGLKSLHRLEETKTAFSDEIGEAESIATVALSDAHHSLKIGVDQPLTGNLITLLITKGKRVLRLSVQGLYPAYLRKERSQPFVTT